MASPTRVRLDPMGLPRVSGASILHPIKRQPGTLMPARPAVLLCHQGRAQPLPPSHHCDEMAGFQRDSSPDHLSQAAMFRYTINSLLEVFIVLALSSIAAVLLLAGAATIHAATKVSKADFGK